jgi:tRNA(Ile)-lysidine synthase
MSLVREVKQSIDTHRTLSYGDRVLVAVSGGPDSVALLHLLYGLRQELGLHLEVAHLQHGIRGEEAQADARFVAEVAAKMELPLHFKEVNLPQIKSAAGKGNLEALARDARYLFFATVARERNLGKIATAHTEDDQAETVLMWLLRGAGMKGLGGMAPIQSLNIPDGDSSNQYVVVRPLLEVSKAEILEFLREKQLTYRVDRSNQEPLLRRNWIRLRLIPLLKDKTDAGLSSRLARQAELIRDEERLLDELAQAELGKIRTSDRINGRALCKYGTAMQRRLLRLWIEQARGDLRGMDFHHVDALLRLIGEGPPQARLSLPGGWELVKEYETLRLQKNLRTRRRYPCYSYELVIGAELNIPEAGMAIQSRKILPPLSTLPNNSMEAAFDMAALGADQAVIVRNFRHGDRFQPFGMAGHKKLKDFFIENKLALSVRASLPLLVLGDEVIWVPGYGRSEIGRVRAETKTILYLTAVPVRALLY